jgi:hypothetical protein
MRVPLKRWVDPAVIVVVANSLPAESPMSHFEIARALWK